MRRKILVPVAALGWLALAAVAGLICVAAWAIAPVSSSPVEIGRTARSIARAPFADHLVIGDSRVARALATDVAQVVGYGGASARQLQRLSSVLCALAPGRVTIALGINDTRVGDRNLTASRAAFNAIARDCARADLRFALVWPVELDVRSAGGNYAPEAIAAINAHIADAAQQR